LTAFFYGKYYAEYKLNNYKLTVLVGPSTSEKYWEVIAERRRKALEQVLDQNSKLHALIMALEEENSSCKKTLEQTTNLLNTLTVCTSIINVSFMHMFIRTNTQLFFKPANRRNKSITFYLIVFKESINFSIFKLFYGNPVFIQKCISLTLTKIKLVLYYNYRK